MRILRVLADLGLPEGMLAAGALYQTVWNHLTGRPAGYGIRDFDIAYFDPDLSFEAEDRVIARLRAEIPELAERLEPRNQARVHLWFPERFGFAVLPLSSAAESLSRYASIVHAVAVMPVADGELRVIAPFGLDDLFALRVRPNRILPNGPSHDAKANRVKALWPELEVELWDGTVLAPAG